MCGIAGVISLNPHLVEQSVRRMTRAMVHRGPDDEGFEQFPLSVSGDGPAVGFGFRRLAIMDLSTMGHQPMVNRATGDALIFNGEIYNFRVLRTRLEGMGRQFRSSGDTEVLLHALSAWGDKTFDMLDGMYAIAFYHATSRRVLLARDPLGIKPLYVSRLGGTLVFASEVQAVLASGCVPDEFDPAGIASFLAYGAPQDPLTVHKRIASMPAATFEWIDEATLAGAPKRQYRHWRLPPVSSRESGEDFVAEIRCRLAEAVRLQVTADVPLGVFLSGGMDSASLAMWATTEGEPPHTFAVGYENEEIKDETTAAAETARFLGTRHFQVVVDDEWAIMQWHEWLKAADRPSIDGLNTYIVSGAVKDRGIAVALSGLGADEIFGGYDTFFRIPTLYRAISALAYVPRGMRRRIASMLLFHMPAWQRGKAVDLLANGGSIVEAAVLSRRLMSDDIINKLGLDSHALGLTSLFLPVESAIFEVSASSDSFQAISQAELVGYMSNTLLRDADTNSMAHSLEIRVPFLGRQVIEYVGCLPGSIRQPKGCLPKHLLRAATAGDLPPSVFSRAKSGFSLPFHDWMYGPLRDSCEAAIAAAADCSAIDGAVVRKMWDESLRAPHSMHWSRPLALVVLGHYVSKRAGLGRPALAT